MPAIDALYRDRRQCRRLSPTISACIYASGANAGDALHPGRRRPRRPGQYSVNLATGVYTFAAADAGAALLVSLSLHRPTAGKKLVITNQLMGYTPTFKATFYTVKTTAACRPGLALVLNACTATKLSLPTKTDDYEIQEFDFSAFADATGDDRHLEQLRVTGDGE